MANNSNDATSTAQLLPEDHDQAVEFIVEQLKSRGIFDSIRRECLSDIDTKPGFQNLTQRIKGYVDRFLEKQRWSASLNKNQLRERLRRDINDSSMLKYGLDSFVEGAIAAKKRSFAPQIRQIIHEYTGTTGDNEDDNVNMSNGREYNSWDRYNSHPSYARNDRSDRYDRDYYYSNHSRRGEYDSNSVMEYDVDNTEQDMEVDDSNSRSPSSSPSDAGKEASNEDSSVQARLDSFLQTFKEFSKKQEQHKQKRLESENDSVESVSSDSQDVISKISSGEATKPITNRPSFKFNFKSVKGENTASNFAPNTSATSLPCPPDLEESKDNFSPQDMNLDEVSTSSDQPSVGTPLQQSELTEDVRSTIKSEDTTSTSVNEAITSNSTLPLLPPVTLPPAHLLSDMPQDEDFSDDELSNSPKAPTPEPISPGSIDMNLEDDVTSETPSEQVKNSTHTAAQSNTPPIDEKLTSSLSNFDDSHSIKCENDTSNSIRISQQVVCDIQTTHITSEPVSPPASDTSRSVELTLIKKEPKIDDPKVKESTSLQVNNKQSSNKNKISVKKESITANVPSVPNVPLEEILSDVSSVHTSDLSDFDDCISISSSEEVSLTTGTGEGQEALSLSVTLNSTAAPTVSSSGRRKISLQEVKQQLQAGERVTSASSSVASSSGSNSHGNRGKAKKVNPTVTSPAQITESKQNTSGKGRQRKINPKYASDEYFT